MLDLSLTVPEATVAALEALSDPARRVTVEAWVMPEATTELCSEDSDHGPGLVQVPITSPKVEITEDSRVVCHGTETVTHSMCLKCATQAVGTMIEDGETWVSLDITR
jgi:hypothetical protein